MRRLLALSVFSGLALACAAVTAQDAGDEFGKQAKYRTPSLENTKAQLLAWLKNTKAPEELQKKAAVLWDAKMAIVTGPRLLHRVGETIALIDPQSKELVELTGNRYQGGDLPDVEWLNDEKLDPLVSANLRLLYGRWLCQEKLYDESLALLTGVKPENVVDPASLLFYQSVACHRLQKKKEGQQAIRSLLEDVADSPLRYIALAGLMQQDLNMLKDGSLDDVSRRMEDVERRLELARAGKRVRRKEDEIVAMLDKLIEKMEKEQQKQQQQQQQQGGAKQSTKPAPDSGILPGQGPGRVDPRNLGRRSGWGTLPAKKRQEALQQLGKDFPAHYRAIIEQYFRRVAGAQEGRGR